MNFLLRKGWPTGMHWPVLSRHSPQLDLRAREVLAQPAALASAAVAIRPSVASHHINALTGVRGFAALWVFAFHSWLVSGAPKLGLRWGVDLSPLFKFGWLGVDVFFVLSGFLLTRQAWNTSQRPHSLTRSNFARSFGEPYGDYLRRRILRVYPAYYGCLTVLLLLAATHVYMSLPGRLEFVLHLGMMHNVIERYIATMDGVFWTLPFEWQFYFCFPLMFIFLRRYGTVALYGAALAVAVAAKAVVMMMNNGYLQVFPLIRLDEFAAGMCAAMLAMRRPFNARLALVTCCIGLGGLVATPWIFADHSNLGHYYDSVGFLRPIWLEATICLLLLGLTGARHRVVSLFDNKVVLALGLVSYSIYLFHVPILELLLTRGLYPSGHTLLQVVGRSLPIVIVVSVISYWFIERPFQAAGHVRHGAVMRGIPSLLVRLGPIRLIVIWAILLMLLLLAVARSR